MMRLTLRATVSEHLRLQCLAQVHMVMTHAHQTHFSIACRSCIIAKIAIILCRRKTDSFQRAVTLQDINPLFLRLKLAAMSLCGTEPVDVIKHFTCLCQSTVS